MNFGQFDARTGSDRPVALALLLLSLLASRAAVLFARLAGRRAESARRRARLATRLFVLAYLLTWTGFALLAMLAQWTLDDAAAGPARHPIVLGLALAAAGTTSGHPSSTPAWSIAARRCPASWPAGATAWPAPSGAARRTPGRAWAAAGC